MSIALTRSSRNLLALCCLAICAGVFVQTLRDFAKYPAGDLRNRVTGARRLADGIDPYLWPDASLPELYRAFSPTSVSPAQLLLYAPLRNTSYETQRMIYFALDWILVAICITQLLSLAPASLPRMPILLIVSIFFLLDNSLRLHFARGQIYVLLLASAVVAATGMRPHNPGWIAPFAFALLLLFRPTYAITAVASMFAGRWKLLRRTTATLLILGAVTIAATGVTPWLEYLRFLEDQTHDHLSLALDRPIRSVQASTIVEGMDSRRFLRLNGYVQDQSFIGLAAHSPRLRALMVEHQPMVMLINFLLLVICASGGLFIAWRASRLLNWYLLAAWIFLLPFDLESFGPQRYPYSDVLLVLPAAMLMFAVLERHSQSPDRLLIGLAILAIISALISRIAVGPVALITTIRFLAVIVVLNLGCLAEIFSASGRPPHDARKVTKTFSHQLVDKDLAESVWE